MTQQRPVILVFVDWYLPGYRAGGPIRSVANMVRELGDEYRFRIVTTNTDFGVAQPYKGVASDTWVKGPQGEEVFYFSPANLNRKAMRALIRQTAFDLVYLNSFFSLAFSIWPLWILRKKQPAILLAPRGMLGAGALKLKAAKKKVFLFASKLLRLHKRIAWHASTELEAAEVKALFGNNARTFTALNIPGRVGESSLARTKQAGQVNLFFLSRISPKKNLLEAIQWLGELQLEQGAQVAYDIYGPIDDAAYWQACKATIATLPAQVRVTHHGAIDNSQLTKHLANAHFLLLPTRHENYGHAILESFALGLPVIISDQTPWRNLEAESVGWDVPVADANAFKKVLQQAVAMNTERFGEMSQNAVTFAQRFTNNSDVLEQNRAMFNSLLANA